MAIAFAEVVVPVRKSQESSETGERLRSLRNERGFTAREVATGMGHSSPAVTAASYLGTSRGRRQAAAEQLAALIVPPETPRKGQPEGQTGG